MSSFKRNFLYQSSYQILILLLPLITTPYISRVLSPEGIGVYSYNYSIAYYFSMFAILGLNNYGNRTIASVRDDKKILSKEFISIYIIQFIATVFVSICYLGYCFLFSNNLISYLFLIYVFSSIFDINWFFMGIENFKLYTFRNIVVNILSVICIFTFVKSSNDLYTYILILVGGRFLGLISVLPMLSKYIQKTIVTYSDIKKHIKPNLILFIPILAVSLYKIMDKIMLGIMSTSTEVGYYESAEKIIKIPLALISSLGNVMLPRMSNLVSKKSHVLATDMIEKSLYFAIFLSCSCSFGIMAIAKYFVPWFYGNNYMKCILIFQILMPSCIFLAIGNVVRTQFLIPYKKDMIFLKSVMYGAIINLIVNMLLINELASIGVSIGTLVAEICVCTYQILKTRKYIDFVKIFKQALPIVLASFFMYIILIIIKLPFISNFINMILYIVIGVFLFCLFFLVLLKMFKIHWKDYFK